MYLVFAFNISGDPKVNLTAITLVIGGILFYKGHIGRIYQKNAVDVIEMVCYFNICSFSAVQLFVLQRKTSHQQSINYTAYLSGTVTFMLLLSIAMYHATWCLKNLILNRNTTDNKEYSHMITNSPNVIQSSSEIEGVQNCDRYKSASQDLDDVASIASIDSTTPLLD